VDPQSFYIANLERLSVELKKLRQRRSLFGITRFGTLAALIVVLYFFYKLGWWYVSAFTVMLLILFRWLVLKDVANKAAISNLDNLIKINKEEISALNNEYFQFDNGAAYTPKDHFYANDIDIIGHASLYQFCNRTTSWMGNTHLVRWMLESAPAEEILNRQEGIKELSLKRGWAQQLQAYGMENIIKENTYSRLKKWLEDPVLFLGFTHWKWLRILLPAIIVSITVGAILEWIPMNFFYGSLLVFAIIAYQVNKIVAPLHEQLSKMVNELDTLCHSITSIENEKFESPLLNQLQQSFDPGEAAASKKIRHLKKILDRLDLRYNIVLSAPLNLLFLWNLQQALSLEKWKKNHIADVEGWFSGLGTFEALSSFGTIAFNNPSWTFPQLSNNHFEIEARELGHPLINKNKRKNNDIVIEESSELMIVTGSNMAGKSTYLRSIGINVILAMAGAPVCAAYFRISPVQLISSMRVSDNLEESTSTFYAELKKLKLIIDKVNKNEKIFILLDEILRGTNSLDRHTGSMALVKQLIKHNASGIIATHDVALAEMKKEFPGNILNYHFDAEVNDDELYFDYKLKPGISKSLNASMLMKKIGIEL